nr:peptidase C39 [Bacteroidales bacterium]
MRRDFPLFTQLDAMDCGPTCLRMVAAHYGRHYNLETLRQRSSYSREGVSLL